MLNTPLLATACGGELYWRNLMKKLVICGSTGKQGGAVVDVMKNINS